MSKVKVERKGQWIIVYKDDVKMKSFNLLEDDYANTNADNYAYYLRRTK